MVKLSDKKPKASTARMRELESMVDHYRRTRLELVDALPIGVFEIDLNGKFVYANRRAFEMSGYTRMDLEKGVNAFQMFIPGERERVRKNTQRVMRGEMLGKNEYQALRKDGVSFPVEIQSARILNHRGKAVGLRGIIEDITQRKQMEAALRNSEEKWRSLATTAPAVILMVGRDGLIRFLNRTVGEYTPENSIGTSVYKYVPPRHRKILKKNIEGVFRTGEPDSYEIIGDGPEGPGSAWYQTHVGPITSEGKVIAVTLIAHDITKRKLMEKALREQKETLERKNIALREIIAQIEVEKNKIKDDILANVDEVLMPILKKLKLKGASRKYTNLLRQNLEDLTSSFGRKISDKRFKLSPREIEICDMIKNGLSSKEISGLLAVSPQTVEKHRKNIREKLGISNKGVNLTTFLQQL